VKRQPKAAFTLLDLLFAVAILGILIALAAPKLMNAKARGSQIGAKAELSEVYIYEKNFRQQFKTFHWDLPLIGFKPKGLTAADLSTAMNGSKRRYVIYAYYNLSAPATPVKTPVELGMTATATYDPELGFGADPALCALAANGDRLEMIYGMNGSVYPAEVAPTTFEIYAMGCPGPNVPSPMGVVAQRNSAIANMDLIRIKQDATIKIIKTKFP
jgi:Tfp pilus assembly protein PilE